MSLCLLVGLCHHAVFGQFASGSGNDYTPDEVAMWRDRALNGPFRVAGDAGTNSPGDWIRIDANATKFALNPAAGRYRIQPTSGCVQQTTVALSPENQGTLIRDAAYYYLVKKAAGGSDSVKALAYAAQVRIELLAQMREKADNSNPSSFRLFDFTNTNRWCSDVINDLPPNYYIGPWMERLRKAYDYTRDYSGYTSGERAELQAWFVGCAYYFKDRVVDYYLNGVFSGRGSGNYTITNGRNDLYQYSTAPTDQLYYGSTKIVNISRSYNNRRGAMVQFIGAVGVMFGDATLKASAKLYFQECMRFSVYPLGLIAGRRYCLPGELERGSDGAPEQGWQYSMVVIGQLQILADYFARSGDSSLYAYETSAGPLSLGIGPKSLKNLLYGMACLQNKTLNVYCTTQSNREGNALYRLDGFDPINNKSYVLDIQMSAANRYYGAKDAGYGAAINGVYLRKSSGTNPWPAKPLGAGSSGAWTGPFGAGAPAYAFMYADTENKPSNNYLPNFPTRYNVAKYHLESTVVSSSFLGYNKAFATQGDSIRLASRWVSEKSNLTDSAVFNFNVPVQIDSIIVASGVPSFNEESRTVTRFSPDRNMVVYYFNAGTWTEAFHVYNNTAGLIKRAVNIPSCTKLMYKSLKTGGYYSHTRAILYLPGKAVTP